MIIIIINYDRREKYTIWHLVGTSCGDATMLILFIFISCHILTFLPNCNFWSYSNKNWNKWYPMTNQNKLNVHSTCATNFELSIHSSSYHINIRVILGIIFLKLLTCLLWLEQYHFHVSLLLLYINHNMSYQQFEKNIYILCS